MKWNDLYLRIGLGVLAIVVSLALTAGLILLVGSDPVEVFRLTWDGAFRIVYKDGEPPDMTRIASVLNFWIPLTLAAAGLVVTFTAGLWNIGVEGQMMMGAIFASWGAQFINLPQPLLIPVCLLLAAAGGIFWALLVGVLKTRAGVNEIFGGVALNALASLYSIYLISGPWQPPEGGSAQSTAIFPEASHLPVISAQFPVSLVMLVVTIVGALAVMLILNGTRLGLEMRATGKNAKSALLMGVPTERTALLALALCGALAGMGGAHRSLHTYQALRPLVTGGIGFLSLLVVLLVSFRAIAVPLATFALAALYTGSTRVKVALQLDQSLVGVLQGLMVLTILLFNGVRERIVLYGRKSHEP